MPNRIIKESIRTSKKVSQMSDFEYRVWSYLITYVDDYGRGSADPELLKGFLFPRLKRVRESDIVGALHALAGIEAIVLYEVGGESLLCFPNWEEHQNIRAKRSKFPSLDEADVICMQVQADESKCSRNPIQSESSRESESESNTRTGAQGDLFDLFWHAYPKRKSKGDAEKAWKAIKPSKELVAIMLEKLAQAKTCRDWLKENGQFIPYPASWLRAKGWEDEYERQNAGFVYDDSHEEGTSF